MLALLHEMMISKISKNRSRKAGYIIIIHDSNQNFTKAFTRIVHKKNGKALFIGVETEEGLYEAMLSVEMA